VPISAALHQGPHIKVAAVASRWQRVGDLIGSGSEPYHTSGARSKRLTTCRFLANLNVIIVCYSNFNLMWTNFKIFHAYDIAQALTCKISGAFGQISNLFDQINLLNMKQIPDFLANLKYVFGQIFSIYFWKSQNSKIKIIS